MSTVTLLFPGQGSQTPEMRDLVAQRCPELLERCHRARGRGSLRARRGEHPLPAARDLLRLDRRLARACRTTSRRPPPPGHSLGELGALAAAGVLTVDDALELVVLRGRLMAEADDRGSMIALVGADADEADAIAAAADLTVANDNAPGQIVLAGDPDHFERAEAEAEASSASRTIRLPVAGAFHSPSMAPAVAPFRAALDEAELHEPRFTVYLLRLRRSRSPTSATSSPAR